MHGGKILNRLDLDKNFIFNDHISPKTHVQVDFFIIRRNASLKINT